MSMSCMSGTSVVFIAAQFHIIASILSNLTPTHDYSISDNLEQIDSFGIDLDMICQLGRTLVHLIEINE